MGAFASALARAMCVSFMSTHRVHDTGNITHILLETYAKE